MKFNSIDLDFDMFFNKFKRIMLTLYIDNLLIFFCFDKIINKVKKQLFEKFNMKDMSKIAFILNIRIKCD